MSTNAHRVLYTVQASKTSSMIKSFGRDVKVTKRTYLSGAEKRKMKMTDNDKKGR